MRIIDHDDPKYRQRWRKAGTNRFNGAFYYSKEIRKNIIPLVKTDRTWVLINSLGICDNHAIIFCHNNKDVGRYTWLNKFDDIVLVCGVKSTVKKLKEVCPKHKVIYLPLSIDIANVKTYSRKKDRDTAFVGRSIKKSYGNLPDGIDYLEDMPRTRLLRELARFKKVYAVGRCAIEAKALGCKVLPYDPRYPNPVIWRVLDNRAAAEILQERLDKIDKKKGKKNGGRNGK